MAHTQGIAVFVGLPLRSFSGSLYNVAALLSNAEKILIYPKTFIPNYGEFYEKRWFTPFEASCGCNEQMFDWPVGGLLKINDDSGFTGAVLAAEVCEDAWVPLSPSTVFCLNGANVIVNLSAGNEVIGKASYRKDLILGNSAKNVCAYVYANAGMGESTQDLVFSGHSLIAENGSLLAEKKPFDEKNKFIISDIDIEKINHERIRMETFSQNSSFFKNSQSSNQSLPAKFQEITVKSTDFLKNENIRLKAQKDEDYKHYMTIMDNDEKKYNLLHTKYEKLQKMSEIFYNEHKDYLNPYLRMIKDAKISNQIIEDENKQIELNEKVMQHENLLEQVKEMSFRITKLSLSSTINNTRNNSHQRNEYYKKNYTSLRKRGLKKSGSTFF